MIVGKNSAKKGFTWYFKTVLKLISGIATIAYIGEFAILGVIGIIATLLFSFEQYKEWEEIDNKKHTKR